MLKSSLRRSGARALRAQGFRPFAASSPGLHCARTAYPYLSASPNHGYATFSSGTEDFEIDLITLRRKSAPENPLVPPFPTVLDQNSPINGKYDPQVVDKVLSKKGGRAEDISGTPATRAFVAQYHKELEILESFIRLSYANTIPDISTLTSVEISNVLYIFRGLYRKGHLELAASANARNLDEMVDEFLSLLSDAPSTSRSLTTSVHSLLKNPPKESVQTALWSSGIGNFLPELSVLTKEYDFNTLASVQPIVDKIGVLVTEFSRFLEVNGAAHNYDADFFRVLIYVSRYKHLKLILLDLSKKDVSPKALLKLAKNPRSADVQEAIRAGSAEVEKLSDLINNSSRNILNIVFANVGFRETDSTFAAVSAETEKDVYTSTEKALLESFIETYLPLVCGGVLTIDAFKDPKFEKALITKEASPVTTYLVLQNFFENYDFSLATILGITSNLHIIRAVAPQFELLRAVSLEQLTDAIDKLAEKSSPLILEDAAKVHEALVSFTRLSNTGFLIFEKLLLNPQWIVAWQRHVLFTGTSYPDESLTVVDLKGEIAALKEIKPKVVSIDVMQILGKCLSDFKKELAEFKQKDLRNFKYADIGFQKLLKYINNAVAHAISRNEHCAGSAVTLKNAGLYGQLNELLAANIEPNNAKTDFLDELADNSAAPAKKGYQQIPEELKIHSFVKELEILRNDELKKSFKNSTPEEIVGLVDRRCTEFSQNLENLNPASRMSKSNWAVFMKMGGRLKRLFAINNGNTEILDAVINSQSALDKLEAKLAQKKAQQDAEKAATPENTLYAPGPYVQIPEKLGLHDFVEHLSIFRDELQKPYKDASATEVLDLMEKKTKEVYNGANSASLKINTDNLVSFIKLHAKLKKLLAWNGGNTAILDTLIYSQKVFDNFEAKITSKSKPATKLSSVEVSSYKQIPDDVLLEEYAEELEQLKANLGSNFGDHTAYQVHRELDKMINSEEDPERRLTLGKLQRNIRMLLKHNGGLTFALDTVLISRKVFDNMKNKIASAEATGNKFIMSDFLEKTTSSKPKRNIKYNDANEVLALLNSNTSAADVGVDNPKVEASIRDALASAMSQEESNLKKENPEEYAAINSLTAQKIRDAYTNKSNSTKPIDKESLENFLKSSKEAKDINEENKFREQNAYEWSKSKCLSNRTLESKNFFNPMQNAKGVAMEYLVLTPTGETIYSRENPLGAKHVPEEMVTVLNRVSPSVLGKVSKKINKLQKKNWRVIGGGDNDRLVVVSRPLAAKGAKVWKLIRTIFTTTGMVFVVMLGLHVWLDDVEHGTAPQLAFPPSENIGVMEQSDVDEYEKNHAAKEEPAGKTTLWKRLFWSR